MNGDVHIIAVGSRTPVGLSAESGAAAVRAGVSRVVEHPFMVNGEGEPLVCGLDGRLPPALLGMGRWEALLASPLSEVLEKMGKSARLPPAVKCRVCLPLPRPGFTAQDEGELRRLLAQRQWPGVQRGALRLETLAMGHAGAIVAVEQAVADIRAGGSEVSIVAGVESYLEADTLTWLDSARRISRREIRGGFPPGEGAAALALASESARRNLGAPSLGVVVATAQARETADENSPEGLQGVALTEVFRRVGGALSSGARFDDVHIDINDERARTTDYAFALLRCGTLFRDGSQYTTSVSNTGEMGAASSLFGCVLAIRAFARGYARGQHAIVSSASWDGLRGAMLLRRPTA